MTQFLKDNLFFLVALVLCCGIPFVFYGCQSTTYSLRDPTIRVSRNQLNTEVETFLTEAEGRYIELDREDELRKLLFETGFTMAQTGTINPLAIITTLGTILGGGAVADNIRKRSQLIRLKNSQESKTVTT
jgi:hypothetical protein